jgi:hypothetical protein
VETSDAVNDVEESNIGDVRPPHNPLQKILIILKEQFAIVSPKVVT